MSLSPGHNRDLNEIRSTLAGLTVETKLLRIGWLLSQKYDPDQPREPAGQPGGGRWTSGDPTASESSDSQTTGSISAGDASASTTQEEVVMPDGSRVLTIRIRSNHQTEWDEQNTVTAPDGTRTIFETSGLTQTIRDGETGEILNRSTLTPTGAEPEAFIQKVRGPGLLRPGYGSLLEAAGILYAARSNQNNVGLTTVFAAPASEYKPNVDAKLEGIWVGPVSRTALDALCPRNGEVQQVADEMAAKIKLSGSYLNPQDYGNKVHLLIAQEINGRRDPKLLAEKSYVSSGEEQISYGTQGSIRLDVLEQSTPLTVCVYDHKTGVSGLRPRRASDIAFMVQRNFPGTQRIIMIEVRPKQ